MKVNTNAEIITYPGFEDIAIAEVQELTKIKAKKTKSGVISFKANQDQLKKLAYLSQSASKILSNGSKITPLDLSKREYEISDSSSDISGNLAYLILRASGYKPQNFLFDPFSRSGTIAIEAALFSSEFPVNYYRKTALEFPNFNFTPPKKKKSKNKILASSPSMQNLSNSESHSKLAGVNRMIRFSRFEIKWLEAKLKEGSVDIVVSYPPQFGESTDLEKLYDEFFYQAEFFMKKNGPVVFLLNKNPKNSEITEAAKASKFKVSILKSFGKFELVNFVRNI
jgi:23S rRNA G2445 N2-methylase RlmL